MTNAINQVADLQNRFTPLQVNGTPPSTVRELAIAPRFTLKREEVSVKSEQYPAL